MNANALNLSDVTPMATGEPIIMNVFLSVPRGECVKEAMTVFILILRT